MNDILDWAFALSAPQAIGWLIVLNVSTFALALAAGCLATFLFGHHRIVGPANPLSRQEVIYAAAGIAVNTGITVLGWFLWKADILVIRRDTGWHAWLDFFLLILFMDFGMYVLHRVAHSPWFYPIHSLHHEYDRPWALTLFVMHPLETFGFGMLWLIVITAYSSSWLGLSLYMTANVIAGTLAHLGVEPFPRWWPHLPLLRQVGTSTFHAQHHRDPGHNFGFYTVFWDRLFGTLFPRYDESFGAALEPAVPGRGGRGRKSSKLIGRENKIEPGRNRSSHSVGGTIGWKKAGPAREEGRQMHSPFPGMDPYIESTKGLWEGFHNRLVSKIDETLAHVLPQGYIIDTAIRSYVVLVEEESKPKPGKKPNKKKGNIAVAEPGETPESVPMQAFIAEEFKETFVEIYAELEERVLVRCIEVLSPANKRRGSEGWSQYERKRQALLLGRANFIEIDLLRGGDKQTMLTSWPNSPYTLLVSRANRAPHCRVWLAHFLHRLPVIPVPLLSPEPDLSVDLQPLIDGIYELGRYNERVDYTLPLTPGLSESEASGVQELLKKRPPRSSKKGNKS